MSSYLWEQREGTAGGREEETALAFSLARTTGAFGDNGEPFFLKFICFIYLFLAALDLLWGARASHCGGFSCCRAQAVGMRTSVVVARGL